MSTSPDDILFANHPGSRRVPRSRTRKNRDERDRAADEYPQPNSRFTHQVPIRAEDVPAQAQEEDGRQEDQEDALKACSPPGSRRTARNSTRLSLHKRVGVSLDDVHLTSARIHGLVARVAGRNPSAAPSRRTCAPEGPCVRLTPAHLVRHRPQLPAVEPHPSTRSRGGSRVEPSRVDAAVVAEAPAPVEPPIRARRRRTS